jgi:flagellar motor switch protein FliM
MQLDLRVAFPIIDVLLGGEGKGEVPERNVSMIEEQILETLVHIICRELDSAWHGLGLKFIFEQRQPAEQIARLMPLEEKTLTLSFEITLTEARGTFILMVPGVVSNAMLRKMSAGWVTASRPKAQHASRDRLRKLLLDCPFRMELEVGPVPVLLRDLARISRGGLLVVDRKMEEPAKLIVGGRAMFSARVARVGPLRAANILDHSATTNTGELAEYGTKEYEKEEHEKPE